MRVTQLREHTVWKCYIFLTCRAVCSFFSLFASVSTVTSVRILPALIALMTVLRATRQREPASQALALAKECSD